MNRSSHSEKGHTASVSAAVGHAALPGSRHARCCADPFSASESSLRRTGSAGGCHEVSYEAGLREVMCCPAHEQVHS